MNEELTNLQFLSPDRYCLLSPYCWEEVMASYVPQVKCTHSMSHKAGKSSSCLPFHFHSATILTEILFSARGCVRHNSFVFIFIEIQKVTWACCTSQSASWSWSRRAGLPAMAWRREKEQKVKIAIPGRPQSIPSHGSIPTLFQVSFATSFGLHLWSL